MADWRLALYFAQIPWHCPWDPALTHRQLLQLELFCDEELVGQGEIAPLPGFSRESLRDCYQALCQKLAGRAVLLPPAAAWGWQCLARPLPLGKIPKHAAYPLLQGSTDEILAKLADWEVPLQQAKLKVARRPVTADIELIQTLLKHYPQLKLRLDANQKWDLVQAQQFCQSIPIDSLEYLEQPCLELTDCEKIAAMGCPIALDESLYQHSELPSVFPGLTAFVLKPTLLGDKLPSLLAMAQQHQLTLSISSSYESPLGINHLTALANELEDQSPGLDTLGSFTGAMKRKPLHFWSFAQRPE